MYCKENYCRFANSNTTVSNKYGTYGEYGQVECKNNELNKRCTLTPHNYKWLQRRIR
jgi:hypothetical protein